MTPCRLVISLGEELNDDIGAFVSNCDKSLWGRFENTERLWGYEDFVERCGSSKRFRMSLYCRPVYGHTQRLFKLARPDSNSYAFSKNKLTIYVDFCHS